eukprot:TRINITY_DN67693_c0_g1_i1.p1 TRINITY_DN67693_c0_g1~~TRINITY_DN67693_c0_g1_i1.p1  ORF type:complete len:406 (+),score=21.82 TRINITY_DN67693_c0_g1_i1:159-1220(+)
MAVNCPGLCDDTSIESKLRYRTLMTGVINHTECENLIDLAADAALNAAGYGVSDEHTLSPYELFSGVTPREAAAWATKQPATRRESAIALANTYVRAARTLHAAVAQRFRDLSYETRPLYTDFIHLVCRKRDHAIEIPQDNSQADSHLVHADNCLYNSTDGFCKGSLPMLHFRSHSAALFLNEPTGGYFFYSDSWTQSRTRVRPECGKVVAYTAGSENAHGVEPVQDGRRCALLIWFATDATQAKNKHELDMAERILQGNLAELGDPALKEYLAMHEVSRAKGHRDVDNAKAFPPVDCRNAAAVFEDPHGGRFTCDDYKSFDYCASSSQYHEFMRRSCPLTCGFCHVVVTEEL